MAMPGTMSSYHMRPASPRDELSRLRAELFREEALVSTLRHSAGSSHATPVPHHPAFSSHHELVRLRAQLAEEERAAAALRSKLASTSSLGTAHYLQQQPYSVQQLRAGQLYPEQAPNQPQALHPGQPPLQSHRLPTHQSSHFPGSPQGHADLAQQQHHPQAEQGQWHHPEAQRHFQHIPPHFSHQQNSQLPGSSSGPFAASDRPPPRPAPPGSGPLAAPDKAGRRHTVERCMELYLEGRLEGFEVLKPEATFGSAGGHTSPPTSSSGLLCSISRANAAVAAAAASPCPASPMGLAMSPTARSPQWAAIEGKHYPKEEGTPGGLLRDEHDRESAKQVSEVIDLGDGWMKIGSKFLPAASTDSHQVPGSWPAGDPFMNTRTSNHSLGLSLHHDDEAPERKELKSLYEELHRRIYHHTSEAERTNGASAPPPSAALFPPVEAASSAGIRIDSLPLPPPMSTHSAAGPPPPPSGNCGDGGGSSLPWASRSAGAISSPPPRSGSLFDSHDVPLPWASRTVMHMGSQNAGSSPVAASAAAPSPKSSKMVDLVDASTVAF